LTDVNTDLQNRGLQIFLQSDRVTAARLGITQRAIDDTLYDAFGQRQVSTIYTGLNQYHVVMEIDPQFSQDPNGLRFLYVAGANGRQVPLKTIANYDRSAAPLSINHQGQFPSSTISFNLAPDVSLSDAVTQIQRAEMDMRVPANITGTFTGTAQAY